MSTFYNTIQYYLVTNPTISTYKFQPPNTPFSTLYIPTISISLYLTLTLILNLFPITLSPKFLRPLTSIHSLTLTLISLTTAIAATLSTFHQTPSSNPTWPICFPIPTPASGPTFFWAHVFYVTKLVELLDTLFILLSPSRDRRLSFLHVYHHAVVIVMCYVWLVTKQSLFPVAMVTNASVHVVMYGYYFVCSLGMRPWWKRLVTDFQIGQFVFSFVISGFMLWYHFTNGEGGCEGIWGWCFNAVFNASLLALFVNFYVKNYDAKKKMKKVGEDHLKDKMT